MLNARALALYGASPLPQNGTDRLCVAADNFVIAAARQCRSGQTLAAFTEIKPSQNDDGDLVAYLAEDSEYDDEQARVAAIQRLLAIAGYDMSPIDGIRGAKTDAALLQFIADNKLTPTAAGRSDFFDVLIAAARRPEGTGFVWCNETTHVVMAAVARRKRRGGDARLVSRRSGQMPAARGEGPGAQALQLRGSDRRQRPAGPARRTAADLGRRDNPVHPQRQVRIDRPQGLRRTGADCRPASPPSSWRAAAGTRLRFK